VIAVTSLLWIWKGSDAAGRWYFITVPEEQSGEIKAHAFGSPRGFGSVKVEARIGNVVWRTSCGLLGCITTSLIDGLSSTGSSASGADADGDTVVWGTAGDGDTVVWGTTCADSSCEPVVWRQP